MGLFILRRLGVMILTALCLTFVVFFLTNLGPNLEKLAKTQGNISGIGTQYIAYNNLSCIQKAGNHRDQYFR